MTWRARAHWLFAGLWTVLIVPATVWWPQSVYFVIVASVWANVYAAVAAAEGASASLTAQDKAWITGELERLLRAASDTPTVPHIAPRSGDR